MILWRRQRFLVQCNRNRATSASFTIVAIPPLPTIKVPSLPAPSPLIGNDPNTISSPHCCPMIASHRHVRVPPTPCFLDVVTRVGAGRSLFHILYRWPHIATASATPNTNAFVVAFFSTCTSSVVAPLLLVRLLVVVHPRPQHLYSPAGSATALLLLRGTLVVRPSLARDRMALPQRLRPLCMRPLLIAASIETS
ncbi:hypothetical protein B296_00049849 [Ensete ventricosum]|uniref:Uncharacterized protein n=1 Tax=Ensete ventricosum TaxID=4639 RepID=A0A426X8D1_ENSVE|nr:hypothetical protein B296_00049849 [Ensete ventricosum]